MTDTPTLLSLLLGPWGSDPPLSLSGVAFAECVGIWLTNQIAGSPGHDPIHLLISPALEIVSSWDSEQERWIRAGLPLLRTMAGPVQHFRNSVFRAWQDTVAADLCKRKSFRDKFGFDIFGSHHFLVLPT